MWYTSLLVAHKRLSEWGNSDSILDLTCSSNIHVPTIKKQIF